MRLHLTSLAIAERVYPPPRVNRRLFNFFSSRCTESVLPDGSAYGCSALLLSLSPPPFWRTKAVSAADVRSDYRSRATQYGNADTYTDGRDDTRRVRSRGEHTRAIYRKVAVTQAARRRHLHATLSRDITLAPQPHLPLSSILTLSCLPFAGV